MANLMRQVSWLQEQNVELEGDRYDIPIESLIFSDRQIVTMDPQNCTPFDHKLTELMEMFRMGICHRNQELYEEVASRNDHPGKTCDFYPLLMAGLFRAVDGVLTMDHDTLNIALIELKSASDAANLSRKKSWSSWIFKQDYNSYTDEEAHAELAYADSMIFTACSLVLADQTFVAFINAALCVKSSHQSYATCKAILEQKVTWDSDFARMHFESGTRMAFGAFELMVSFLPSKFVKLLEFAGFSGDREVGLEEVIASEKITEGARWPVSAIILGAYNTFLEYVYGLAEPDLEIVRHIALKAERFFPDSAYFTSARGIYFTCNGELETAYHLFKQSNQSSCAPQFKYINHLYMMMIDILQSKWVEALEHSEPLLNCKWSPASFTYVYACLLNMVMIEQNKPEMKPQIIALLKQVPSLKKTLGGKKAIHEKFVLGRSKDFVMDNDQEIELAPLEFAYISNFTYWIKGKSQFVDPIMDRINKKLTSLSSIGSSDQSFSSYGSSGYGSAKDGICNHKKYYDKLAYLTFFQGVCANLNNKEEEAKGYFDQVIAMEEDIKEDHHSPALAAYEIGLYHRRHGNVDQAKTWLKRATKYPENFADPLISFRTELALNSLKQQKKQVKKDAKLEKDGAKKEKKRLYG